MATIQIKNNRTQKVETIDAELWDKKKEQYRQTFTVVGKPATPPEVKQMEAKQAGTPTTDGGGGLEE